MKSSSLESLLTGNIAVVCHDAGAANIIVSWLIKMPLHSVKAHMEGPARAIWSQAFPNISTFSLEEVFSDWSMLLTGTGWASDLEHKARIKASSLDIFSVAVIDHWTNYKNRFIRNEKVQLPDHICVTDEYAYTLVQELIPDIEASLMPNSYLDEQVRSIFSLKQNLSRHSSGETILYVLEPIRVNWDADDSRSGEFQALDYFITNITKISSKNVRIRIRPHPSDTVDKYRYWVNQQSIKIEISKVNSLAEDIYWSDIVIGCQSYALVVALAAQKRVFSSLPPLAPVLVLPYPGIQQLRAI